MSTSKEIMDAIDVDDRAVVPQSCEFGEAAESRVLGMNWNVEEDVFRFRVCLGDKTISKRVMLSYTNGIFDPLGILAPVVLEARLLFCESCKMKIGWDDPIPDELMRRWNKWKENLDGLKEVTVKRCFKQDSVNLRNTQLHVFADASLVARGSVCYLRTESNGGGRCSFIVGKALLADSDRSTIPRMELEAALDAVKLARMVKRELEIENCSCTYWTDSAIVLQSLYADSKKFPIFSRNRLDQILKHNDWRHVPSAQNPANEASRGMTPKATLKSGMWLNGPKFLCLSQSKWPNLLENKSNSMMKSHAIFDLKTSAVASFFSASYVKDIGLDRLIKYFSSYYKLKRACAWMLRVKQFLKERLYSTDVEAKKCAVTVAELLDAERVLIMYIQQNKFSEYSAILHGKETRISSKSDLYKLNPFAVQGIIRVGGRLDKACIAFEAAHSIVLPENSHLTELIIKDCHEKQVGHLGVGSTLNQLYQKFWIINEELLCEESSTSALSAKELILNLESK